MKKLICGVLVVLMTGRNTGAFGQVEQYEKVGKV